MQSVYLESLVTVCCYFVTGQIWQFQTLIGYFQLGGVVWWGFFVLSWAHLDVQAVQLKNEKEKLSVLLFEFKKLLYLETIAELPTKD